jgi:hypothetical protein
MKFSDDEFTPRSLNECIEDNRDNQDNLLETEDDEENLWQNLRGSIPSDVCDRLDALPEKELDFIRRPLLGFLVYGNNDWPDDMSQKKKLKAMRLVEKRLGYDFVAVHIPHARGEMNYWNEELKRMMNERIINKANG